MPGGLLLSQGWEALHWSPGPKRPEPGAGARPAWGGGGAGCCCPQDTAPIVLGAGLTEPHSRDHLWYQPLNRQRPCGKGGGVQRTRHFSCGKAGCTDPHRAAGPPVSPAAPQWPCEDRGDKAHGDSRPEIMVWVLLLRPEDHIPPLAVPLQCPASKALRLAGGRVSQQALRPPGKSAPGTTPSTRRHLGHRTNKCPDARFWQVGRPGPGSEA